MLFLVQILFSFVSNWLADITSLKNEESLNLNRNKIKPQHVNKFISRPVYEM